METESVEGNNTMESTNDEPSIITEVTIDEIKYEEVVNEKQTAVEPSNIMEVTNNEIEEVIKEEPKSVILVQQSSALTLLNQYSDSEEESVENEPTNNSQYRKAESSSSSSSSSDSEVEIDVKEIRKKLDVPVSDNSDSENEDPTKERKKRQPLRVKGEFLLEDLPPIQDLEIEVDEKECLEIGTVSSIIDQLVLVEAYPHSAPLDIDSVLFLDKGKKALGKVFDVIGQVSTPIYCVRFNTHEDIMSKNIAAGNKVFCAPRTEYANFVILTKIMGKGSDASWKNDVEIPENMIEYSDDEEERNAKKQNKNKDRQVAVPKRRNPPQNNYSWHNQINPRQPNWTNQQYPSQQQQQPQHFQNYGYYPQYPYN